MYANASQKHIRSMNSYSNENNSNRMKKLVMSGVSNADNQFTFDYDVDDDFSIIELVHPILYSTMYQNKVYWFGYKFTSTTSSKDRAEFIKQLKSPHSLMMSDEDKLNFIMKPLLELNKYISTYQIDCFIYPISGQNTLVKDMIYLLNRLTSHETSKMSYELVKQSPKYVEFDWDAFDAEHSTDEHQRQQMQQYIENELLPKIHSADYFSLAQLVKPKYRRYIKNYLKFPDNLRPDLTGLLGKNILIIDDINTSGATLDEILRTIDKYNTRCSIYIFTLIGREGAYAAQENR